MKLPPPKNEVLALLKRLGQDAATIDRLQGNAGASTLLLAPIPTEHEFARRMPWCGPAASAFFMLLQSESKIDPAEFLVIPTLFRGTKPIKDNSEEARAIYRLLIARSHIKQVLCMGAAPFKVYLGEGKCPRIENIAGLEVKTPNSLHKPVFMLPCPLCLVMKDKDEYPHMRDFFLAKRDYDTLVKRTIAVLPKLERLML